MGYHLLRVRIGARIHVRSQVKLLKILASSLSYVYFSSNTVTSCAFTTGLPNTLAVASGSQVAILSLIVQGVHTRWAPLLSSRLPL